MRSKRSSSTTKWLMMRTLRPEDPVVVHQGPEPQVGVPVEPGIRLVEQKDRGVREQGEPEVELGQRSAGELVGPGVGVLLEPQGLVDGAAAGAAATSGMPYARPNNSKCSSQVSRPYTTGSCGQYPIWPRRTTSPVSAAGHLPGSSSRCSCRNRSPRPGRRPPRGTGRCRPRSGPGPSAAPAMAHGGRTSRFRSPSEPASPDWEPSDQCRRYGSIGSPRSPASKRSRRPHGANTSSACSSNRAWP